MASSKSGHRTSRTLVLPAFGCQWKWKIMTPQTREKSQQNCLLQVTRYGKTRSRDQILSKPSSRHKQTHSDHTQIRAENLDHLDMDLGGPDVISNIQAIMTAERSLSIPLNYANHSYTPYWPCACTHNLTGNPQLQREALSQSSIAFSPTPSPLRICISSGTLP